MVIAEVLLIDLLALESKRIYDWIADIGRTEAATEERNKTVNVWQLR